MNRKLRKRHLWVWLLIVVVVLPLVIYAYLNIPVFWFRHSEAVYSRRISHVAKRLFGRCPL